MKNKPITGKGEYLKLNRHVKQAKRCSKCGKIIYEKNKSGLCYFHLSLEHAKIRTDRNVLCHKCKKNLKVKLAKKVCKECYLRSFK